MEPVTLRVSKGDLGGALRQAQGERILLIQNDTRYPLASRVVAIRERFLNPSPCETSLRQAGSSDR